MIAVKVDNAAQPDLRWYTGFGIYRNVWLTATSKLALIQWGIKVNTVVSANANHVLVNVNAIGNHTLKGQQALLINSIYDFNGKLIAKSRLHPINVDTIWCRHNN